VAQRGISILEHASTHKFPDYLWSRPVRTRCLDGFQLGPHCGGDHGRNAMTDNSYFVQQSHNFIATW
jgi:hypothetical protein